MPKPFGPFGAGLPHARTAPRMKSFCAPCLPKKKACLLQLTAGHDLPHSQNLTQQTSPLPICHPNSPTDPKTSPDSPSPLPSPPATGSSTQHMFPLRKVVGPEGPTRVHVPFSLSDMSHIEEKLGSFSENPTRYRKDFLRLSQAYNLTWSDIYYILNATLTPDEKDCICQVAKAHADHLHNQDWDSTIADEAVPQLDPHWTYQPNAPGIKRLNHMIIFF